MSYLNFYDETEDAIIKIKNIIAEQYKKGYKKGREEVEKEKYNYCPFCGEKIEK